MQRAHHTKPAGGHHIPSRRHSDCACIDAQGPREAAASDLFDDLGCVAHASYKVKLFDIGQAENVGVTRGKGGAKMPPMSELKEPGRFLDIAERLRRARSYFGYENDQAGFYQAAGIGGRPWTNWESGDYRISVDGALKLRDRYAISLDWIYCDNADALPHKIAVALKSMPRDKNSNSSNEK